MREHFIHFATVFMGFVAIMNPIANTPLFLAITGDDDKATRKAIALKALLLTFVIIVGFCVAGKYIFEVFSITLPAFKVTGGVLVALIGFHMLNGKQSPVHAPVEPGHPDPETVLSKAISPLAVPLLAGPGTIATAMNYVEPRSLSHLISTIVAFGLLCVITYFSFVSGERLVKFLGHAGIGAVTRLMGLILGVIGTQMVIDGIQDLNASGAAG